jgi:tRNA threonylcarbamoyladenosine biosynthesis protein TsaB
VSRLILAVDTTHEYGSLALLRADPPEEDRLLEEVEMHAPHGFAHVLYGHLAGLLERHCLTSADIDCFAATSGPGSFTGVRVGLACVKGLAEATGRPAVAVSNLQTLASFGKAALRAVVMDARRGEVYGAVYDHAGCLVTPEVVAPFAAWMEMLPTAPLEFIAFDYTPALADTRFARATVRTAPRAIAAAAARLGSRAEPLDPAALDANYVRRCDAELHWKE